MPEYENFSATKFFIYDKYNKADLTMTFNVSCSTPIGAGVNYTQNGVVATAPTMSVQILQNSNCSLSLTNFFDGTSSYSPSSTPLIISISAAGVVTSSASAGNPPAYVKSGGAKAYLFMISGTSTTISFEYLYDPVQVALSLSGF